VTLEADLAPAFAALDDCDVAVAKLDAGCCEPGRSPRMKALAGTLGEARTALGRVGSTQGAEDQALALMEDVGGQVGSLQVGCCTPKRLPLYARILENLTTAQITLAKALGRGHGP
jgi:hypothetical protein